MVSHIITRGKVVILGLLVIPLVFIFAGCKGDTGSAGTAGATGEPGSFATSGCDACHHLNSLAVNEFNETFVSGLAGSDKTISAATSTTLSFDATKLPAGETAQSFVWTRTNGLAATIGTANASSTLITLPTVTSYKEELFRHVKGQLITTLDGTVLSDRGGIVPVNPLNFEEAFTSTFKLRVATASGKFFFGLVNVVDSTGETAVDGFATVNNGINNVPINVPMLLRATTSSGYLWSVTTAPTVTAAILNDANTQFPDFTPLVPGQYVLTQGTGTTTTITLYAGTWLGVITGQDANGRPVPDSICFDCHGTTAPDKFTPWKASGHAEIFTQNLNASGGSHYSESCFPCHTVGFDKSAVALNNGIDDQTSYPAFLSDLTSPTGAFFNPSATNWTRMLATYPAVARLANIQCENCHGPQVNADIEDSNPAHGGVEGDPRISLSADVCGACHGEPQRHARFQQWEDSGHGNYELAVEEGTGANCAGCHSAQGFFIYLDRLQSGIPLRSIPTGSITWTEDTVLPQTCSVCHDPHAQGTTSGEPNTATVRVEDKTPKLPGGFSATGVGRGAICIICHNSRNGGSGADSFLHQDGDPVFGSLTGYSGPHEACQGDVLMGYNAYFVGNVSSTNSQYRSPHSIIADTCTTCHMELTPPPALLSYNLAGTNHSFRASLNICSECHPVNTSLGPMLQATVKSTLEALQKAIGDKIISRYTGTGNFTSGSSAPPDKAFPIDSIVDLGSRGTINIISNGTATTFSLDRATGVKVCTTSVTTNCLNTDDLAKALWNFYLIEQDQSFGVHNPDFTFSVLGASQFAVDSIPNATVPSNEL